MGDSARGWHPGDAASGGVATIAAGMADAGAPHHDKAATEPDTGAVAPGAIRSGPAARTPREAAARLGAGHATSNTCAPATPDVAAAAAAAADAQPAHGGVPRGHEQRR